MHRISFSIEFDNLLTVVNVEVCQSFSAEERSFFHIHKAVFTLFLFDDLLYPVCPLVHQVPAPDATVKSRVYLMEVRINAMSKTQDWRLFKVVKGKIIAVYWTHTSMLSSHQLTGLMMSVRLGRPAI